MTDADRSVRAATWPYVNKYALELRVARLPCYVAALLATLIGAIAWVILTVIAILFARGRSPYFQISAVVGTVLATVAGTCTIVLAYRCLRWTWRVWDGKACWACKCGLSNVTNGICPQCGNEYDRKRTLAELAVMAESPIRRRELLSDLCLGCGYPMVGNTTGICPECGTRFYDYSDA
jgi:predicted RNA-binding Zn-ribbon protein involved in translation (DUF1610 family)